GRSLQWCLQGIEGVARPVRGDAGGGYADHRTWLYRPRDWRGHGRLAADHRVHDVQLRLSLDRPDFQLGRQDALDERWSVQDSDHLPGPIGRRAPAIRS